MHGFGFADALLDTGLAGHDVPMTLLLFNLGIEFGQIDLAAACGVVLWGCDQPPRHADPAHAAQPRRRVRPGRRRQLLGDRAGRRILGVRRGHRERAPTEVPSMSRRVRRGRRQPRQNPRLRTALTTDGLTS